MTSSESPDAWLGLLKWSLSHQDGTAPSEPLPMGDEDRAWLEKVMSEGVRDDFKAMTDIYGRLCAYLDLAATNPSRSLSSSREERSGATSAATETAPAGSVTIGSGPAIDFVPPPPSVDASASGTAMLSHPVPEANAAGGNRGALSTFVAPSSSSPATMPRPSAEGVTEPGTGTAATGSAGEGVSAAEELAALEEGVMNDLDELQDIVEQIDAAATFAKIGGFGRLIALVAHTPRPEKLRLRAASVIATLTKNNPPAQAAFSSSGGHKALIEAATPAPEPSGTTSSSPSRTALSLPLQRAILHALSSSVMGLAPVEDALCLEPRFQDFLGRALSQEAIDGSDGDDAAVVVDDEESHRLRSKAAFVLKALISAPESNRERAKALWPAVLGLLTGLEALAGRGVREGEDNDPAAARETCIEALLASARSRDGDRVVRELGSRIGRVAATRRQVLVEAAETGTRSQEDVDSMEVELGLWMEWDALTGPAQ